MYLRNTLFLKHKNGTIGHLLQTIRGATNVSQAQCPRSQPALLYVLIPDCILTSCTRDRDLLAQEETAFLLIWSRQYRKSPYNTRSPSTWRKISSSKSSTLGRQGYNIVPWVLLGDLLIFKCFTQKYLFKSSRASLVGQWLGICLPMQGTRVWALVREDPTCCGATKPVRHNYWSCTLEPMCHNYWSPGA